MPELRIRLPNEFEPRSYQRPFMAYLDNGGKRAVWVMHRRGGKDLTALHQTCKMMHQRKGMYWHVFPTGEQARKAIWEGFTKEGQRVLEQVFPTSLRKSPKAFLPNGEMVIELKCGSIWRLLGSDRIEVVGAGPIGVVFSEFALAKPRAWDLIRPMLRENDGWAAFITTPRGNNHAKRLYDVAGREQGWFRELLTLYDTRAYDPERTIAEEQAEGMPEALIRQEYFCDWTAALVGSVWGDLIELLEKNGGVGEAFPLEDNATFTSWDLGFTDAAAIWFWQLRPDGIDFVDFYQSHGQPLSHYFDYLEERQKTCGYKYVKHWLPHDAKARTMATGTSILEQFINWCGTKQVALGPSLSLLDGIQAVRWMLQHKIRFHARCEEGVEALKHYRWEYDEEKKTFSKKPVHDWASHPADSMRYAACVVRASEILSRKPPAYVEKPAAVPLNKAYTLDELFRDHKARLLRGGGRV